jgi:hypothetical protein
VFNCFAEALIRPIKGCIVEGITVLVNKEFTPNAIDPQFFLVLPSANLYTVTFDHVFLAERRLVILFHLSFFLPERRLRQAGWALASSVCTGNFMPESSVLPHSDRHWETITFTRPPDLFFSGNQKYGSALSAK